jgi:hypothetical protein
MYQQQQYHTANYRGNQPGHDLSLRADSQQPSSMGKMVASQYRGLQRQFQPTGFVPSYYGQNQQNTQFVSGTQQFQAAQQVNPASYHTANYRGNQPGHDISLRADSQQASNIHAGYGSSYSAYQSTAPVQGQSFGYQAQQQFVNPASYHTANYRGNQPGHDISLRADSQQASNIHAGQGSSYSAFQTSAPVQGRF